MKLFKKKERQTEFQSLEEEKDYENMLIRHKRRMSFLLFGLFFLVLVTVIGIKIYLDRRGYDTYEVSSVSNIGDVSKCRFYPYRDGMLQYSNDGISYIVGKNAVWDQAFEMKQPVLDICEGYMAIADLRGTKIYIYNESGQQGEVTTTAPILALEVANQGVIAAITQGEKANLIEVYDKDGTTIAVGQTVLSGDGCPLSISLSNDGTKLMVSYVYLDNSVAKTKVIFYNYSEVGKNQVGRIVGGFEHYDGTLVSKTEFVTNDVAVAFGDDLITIYAMKQKPSIKKELNFEDEIESIVYTDKYIGVILKSRTVTNQHLLKIFTISGRKIYDGKVDFAYTDVQMNGDTVVFNNGEQMYVLSVDGILKYNGKVEAGVLKVIPQKAENKFVIITEKGAEEIKLK